MRILKYLLLLLLLSLVAFSIFIATQKGEYSFEKSKIINADKSTVFNYVLDLQNSKDWNSLLLENSNLETTFSENTTSIGSFCNWTGNEGDGELETTLVKAKDSINQTLNFNGNSSKTSLIFKDTLGKTKITWKIVGKMSYFSKVKSIFNLEIKNLYATNFEKSLVNLNKKLVTEKNTFSVKVQGITIKSETFYVAKSFTSTLALISKNVQIVSNNLINYCYSNSIPVNGKPFVIYHKIDDVKKTAKISICLPVSEFVEFSENSQIVSDTLKSFEAVKTILRGDYIHLNKVIVETKDFFKKNNLRENNNFSRLEIYSISANEINNPSKWKTDIYFPTRKKEVVKKTTVVIEPISTNAVVPAEVEEVEVPSEF